MQIAIQTIEQNIFRLIKQLPQNKLQMVFDFIQFVLVSEQTSTDTNSFELERKHAEGYAKYPVQVNEFDIWYNEQIWEMSNGTE
ncbi:MAG: hypothetical protein B6242_10830 [Anaerolineaceae bacterium 4572_78]|nr:MAG: hypothetical protein B6242_10830 [Anaerolineaceae bacterium 4572_78]